jgi:hypothetical protein
VELPAAAWLFQSAPRGALRDDLACPAGVAIQIHQCNLGPFSSYLDRAGEKAYGAVDLRASEGLIISLAGDV